jgi:hypothetical protein
MGAIVGLDTVVKRKIPSLFWEWNPAGNISGTLVVE